MQTRSGSRGGKRTIPPWRRDGGSEESIDVETRREESDIRGQTSRARKRTSAEESLDAAVAAAESWDYVKESDAYEKAQMEREEAEALEMFEQAHEESLRQIAESELVDRTRHVELLKMGSAMLTNPSLCDRLTYEELSSVQDAARRLEKLCDEQKENFREMERAQLLRDLYMCKATIDIIHGNSVEREARLISTISKMNQQMEKNKEKDKCIVCFANQRNAQVLPCMHFEYCTQCLATHRQRSNTCPTCRTPIRGILDIITSG